MNFLACEGGLLMASIIQQLITGISIGSIYALLAVGYALIYSIFDFTNFAFGSLMMCCAYASFFAISYFSLPLPFALVLILACGILISVVTELVAYRPMRNKNASRLFLMIAAMGVDLVLTYTCVNLFSTNVRPLSIPFLVGSIQVGGVSVAKLDVCSGVVALVLLLLLWTLLYKTKYGIAIRASSVDTKTAGLMGINVNVISLIVFALSGVMAAFAGMFFGLKYAVYPTLGSISNKAFISSVIGGLGSLPGAVIGALLLGVLETLITGFVSSAWRDVFSFSLMIIILIFRPFGLMGKSKGEKI